MFMNSIASTATGNNGERGTGLFALPSEISIPLSSYHAAKVRIIVVETEKLHTMTIYILRRSNDNLYTLFLDILRLHPQTIFQIIIRYNYI